MRSLLAVAGVHLAALAVLAGFAGAAWASATIDLIWPDTGTGDARPVATSSSLTLQVVLTAGPNGSTGGAISVDYSEVVGTLSVTGYQSIQGGPLPIPLVETVDTGSRIEGINAGAFPGVSGLAPGESYLLGTVTFHGTSAANGLLQIRSDANGPGESVRDLDGNDITSATTFNSAFISGPPSPLPCSTAWPLTQIVTLGKGQSAANNVKLYHVIRGNIVDPGSLGETAHRIAVCAGTQIDASIVDSDPLHVPSVTASDGLVCAPETGCSGVINDTEKYTAISADGRDRDSITFVPK